LARRARRRPDISWEMGGESYCVGRRAKGSWILYRIREDAGPPILFGEVFLSASACYSNESERPRIGSTAASTDDCGCLLEGVFLCRYCQGPCGDLRANRFVPLQSQCSALPQSRR